ncbi:MAG: DNA topoisomerase-3 [Motiliproteus sp.]|jgi:DNA topoisomerase-3
MILYIAEKPSQGRAIAAALPQPHRSGEGFIRVGNGDHVSWCIGHLLEQAEPDAYDPAFKQWQLEHLPIIPTQWQLQPKPKTRKQLSVLRKLVKEADQLVHAGDPDREGQLLVDEVLGYLKIPAYKQREIQRLLVNDLNPSAIQRALQQLRPNRDFIPLSVSALARSRADWLYGINLTRVYTLQGRKVGYQGVLSVGRVQTPLLGLVVRRDQAIDIFVSKPFYELWAELETAEGERFHVKWQPSEACRRYQDEEGRLLSRPLAENVCLRIRDKPARVTRLDKTLKRQAAPLPYNLSALQIDAGKRYGFSAQQVLDSCQALYERHKLITYPRSDCRYLPLEHHAQAAAVVKALAANAPDLSRAVENADLSLKSKAWNDAKVNAHHALIPTQKRTDLSTLSRQEQQLYALIARQYLCQFYPPHQYYETQLEVDIEGGCFGTKARQVQQQGWKALFASAKKEGRANADTHSETNAATHAANKGKEKEAESALLPPLELGQQLQCLQGELREKQTQPPAYFTDASLLAAMTGIARFVEDPEIRKVLKETDGLGTEATRAGIIELLFRRKFMVRQGKQIRSTEAGRGLINSLPAQSTTPDMTAQWEAMLEAICQRQLNYEGFMQPLLSTLQQLIEQAKQSLPTGLAGIKSAPSVKRRRPATRGSAAKRPKKT